MRHLVTLTGWTRADLGELFERADQYRAGTGAGTEGAAVMFFPPTSLRTRVSFELGAAEMGLQPIVLPSETLDTDEDLVDLAGYLASWARLLVVRHKDRTVLEKLASAEALPVIDAMTAVDHPCEILSDLYALSQGTDVFGLRILFVGADGNIARAWWEAGRSFGLDVRQTCPVDLRVPGMPWEEDLTTAVTAADVVITDAPGRHEGELVGYQVTADLLDTAPAGVRFIPCPPFVRGREVAENAVDHPSFVGYRFKRFLVPVQQAVMSWVLEDG
jgi:ornithine carbamoyltransferase